MSIETVTAETLNSNVEIDSPFLIVGALSDGDTVIETYLPNHYAPSVTLYVDRDSQGVGPEEIDSDDWEPVTGYSGQHGYSGPVMHVSETLSAGMARDVVADTGAIYVVTSVECRPDWEPVAEEYDDMLDMQDNPAGWMLLKYTGK